MTISLKSTVAAPAPAYGGLKPSISLLDFNPGTRSWTVPEGVSKIRAFVVGAGGYNSGSGGGFSEKQIDVTPGQILSYTVGSPGIAGATIGGTSSFGGVISATGGAATAGVAGVGSGGETNTSGGVGINQSPNGSGGSAGHSFGNGQAGAAGVGGSLQTSGQAVVDGWKIGHLPAAGVYGYGGTNGSVAGMGGGGASVSGAAVRGGVGAGGGYLGNGGPGLVGIEVIA